MKLNAKIRSGIIIGIMAVVIAVVVVIYAIYMQNQIFEESSNHLSEIYGQTNAFFQSKVTSQRNVLLSWENYITATANDPEKSEEFKTFIDEQKKELNVTRFSFINVSNIDDDDDSNDLVLAKDRDGRVYELDVRRSAKEAFAWQGEGVAVACMRRYITDNTKEYNDNGEREARDDYDEEARFIMIAAKFAEEDKDGNPIKNTYKTSNSVHQNDKAFEYNAIAFFFDVRDISYVLDTKAFLKDVQVEVNGEIKTKQVSQGSCFIVLPYGLQDDSKGLVLLQSSEDKLFAGNKGKQWNFFDDFLNNTNMKRGDVDKLKNEWASLEHPETSTFASRTIIFRANGTEYYLNFEKVEFNDWILVGVVPTEVVNEGMTSLRTTTILVMAVIFIIMGGGVAWIIIMLNRRKIQDRELVIKSRERLFDLLTYNTHDIFVLFDGNTGKAEYVSQNIETVLGFDVDSVKDNVYSVMEATYMNVEQLKNPTAESLSEGLVIEELPMRNVRNKTEYWFRLGINPPLVNGGTKYVLMLSDRTKERQMRADLESALQIAKSANEAKSNFLSNMSHDIRTPMNAIIGFATLLEKDVENPAKVREYIRKISFSSHHMLSLINDILDMSKIESGKSALHVAEFSFPEMLEELYSIIITQVENKDQKFEMRTKGNIPELVYGDRLRLNQVMINLLSNAVKYTPKGGEISLAVEALPESVHNHAHLRLSVKDNGLGMSEDFVKVIFEPFSRETTAATREIQGTGLGMAITKQIVDLMGGTITVKSKRDVGSEFIVEIELAKVTQTYTDAKQFWTENNIRKILVVDDDVDVCIEVKELMSDTGVTVDYATGGHEALDKIKVAQDGKTKYDIVVLDWQMPEMDGLQVAHHIREIISPDLPIMFLTSYNFEEIEEEARETGIQAFLPKPFFVSNFRNAVAKLNSENEEGEQAEENVEFSMEGLNILAAEDNPINAEILEELLDIEGATCTICENGKIALETFEKCEPGTYNMIFMDVQMPVMNGHEASKAIRACSHPEAKTIPIIAMTANAFDDDKKMAYDAGMNAHVAKPIDMDVLKKTVAKLLGGHNE